MACNTSTAVGIAAFRRRYDLPVLGVIRPGASAAALATRNRRVGVIATPATIRSHAYFNAIKDENPAVEVYEHATPDLVPMVEAGELAGPSAEATVAASLAALLGERDADGESIFPRPPGATIDTLLLGCTHYPLLRPIIAGIVGEGVAIVDSATATASALAELLSVNGLEGSGDQPATPSPADDRRRRALRDAGRSTVRDRLPGRGIHRARGARGMTRASSGDRPGATTGRGRPGSSSVQRSGRPRPSSAGGWSGPPARASSIGRPSSGSRSGACEGAPGALDAAELRAAEPAYAEAMARIVPALSSALGTELPGVVERSGVVDRAGWVRANTASFASLIGKLEKDLLDQVIPPGGGLAKATMALANRWITTRQLGLLLGFMGRRVLGQYDLALLSAEAAPGRLLFVEENIRETARALGVPLGPFRTWIALHETTHAFEFEAHPWLRPYLASRLERQLSLFGERRPGLRPRGDARCRTCPARRGRRRALDGAADGRGAAPAVPRDAGRDEPARGLQRLRHGRGRSRPRAGRRTDQRPFPRAPYPPHARSSGRCSG